MIMSYNTTAVNVYNATSSLMRFGNKYFLQLRKVDIGVWMWNCQSSFLKEAAKAPIRA
jgi:hypothetical protein